MIGTPLQWRGCGALALAIALAACGGGGGGVATVPIPPVAPTPTPTPTPAPAPAPTPTPSSFDTGEYRRSAAAQVNALAAYNRGASGQGITVAVIDSGVNPALAEFAGRISPASRDVAASRDLADERGHGTSVAGVAVAARNGSGMHGVAPLATLLALRADTPGSCNDEGCSYTSTAIAAGFDAAVAGGARVINVSLGGDGTTGLLRAAASRAAAAGTVVVLSAGNESLTAPTGFANQLLAAGPATTLVVGAIDSSGALADFTNRAGLLAANFVVAPGVSVRSFNQEGAAFLYNGTSVAAPVVSGAAALLAQAFPALSGAQIVDIILRTADDLGAPGTDELFGRGRLNIERAFAPVGGISSAGAPIGFGGTLGGTLGDGGALRGALAAVPVVDSYQRPYSANLAGSIGNAAVGRLAARLLAQPAATSVTMMGRSVAAFALNGENRNSWAGDRATMAALSPGMVPAGGVSGHVLLALAGGPVLAAGQGEGLAGLVQLADPVAAPAGLITGDAGLGLAARPLGAVAAAQPLGGFTLTAGFGQALLPVARSDGAVLARGLQSTAIIRLSRQFGVLALAGEVQFDDERGALAGTRLAPGFGLAGGQTSSLAVSAQLVLGPVRLAGHWRQAAAQARLAPGLITAAATLRGSAASFSATLPGLLRRGDALVLAAARPLALAGDLQLAGFAAPVRAGPLARETALEAGYALPLALGGHVKFNLFHRNHPGHIAASPDDDGAAVQLGWRW